MFGYVKAFQPQLRVCELEQYNGVYCSLCKTIGRRYGILARFTLSYDVTFLAMLGMAVAKDKPPFETRRCDFNPLKKKRCCVGKCAALDYAAAVGMLMLYHKVRDNMRDGGFFSRAKAYIACPAVSRWAKKARRAYPNIGAVLDSMTAAQREVEAADTADCDRACEPTAAALAEVFKALGGDGERLYNMGYCIGKWVYLADALDDMADDRKTGDYNVLVRKYGGDTSAAVENAVGIMNICAGQALRAFRGIDIFHYEGIIDNILTMGLTAECRRISDKAKER